jgi:uncharacterized membrane protein
MTRFEISVTINKPIDIVTQALNNADNFPYWQTDLERFEVVNGGPDQEGSIGRLHYSQKGRSYIMEDRLIHCEPGRKYVSEVEGDAIFARVETTLQPLDNKTRMNLRWSGRGKIFFLKLFLPFFRGKMVMQAKKELETFKQLVEERGANFGELPEDNV